MRNVRFIQIIAIILLLVAGYLWSRRLAADALVNELVQIRSAQPEQAKLLRQKIESKDDPFELLAIGKKLLEANSPYFAVIPLERATTLLPKYRDGWYLLGYAYIKLASDASEADKLLEHRQKAREALRRAQAIDANHQPTKELLEQL